MKPMIRIAEEHLTRILVKVGVDRPENFDAIAKFMADDVIESADEEDFNSEDFAIAFRRYVETGVQPSQAVNECSTVRSRQKSVSAVFILNDLEEFLELCDTDLFSFDDYTIARYRGEIVDRQSGLTFPTMVWETNTGSLAHQPMVSSGKLAWQNYTSELESAKYWPEVRLDYMADPIAPCPFCGSNNVIVLDQDQAASMFSHSDVIDMKANEGHFVICSATDGGCGAMSGFGKTVGRAVSRWNKRK